jgi:tetratricopeptide (TPR) repeat protein
MTGMMFRAIQRSVLLVPLIVVASFGADLEKMGLPNRWIEPLMPEDLPKLEHPEYFEDFDKAKAQLASGRYKLALATLHSAKSVDPLEAALVRGSALSALGRTDEALSVLSSDDLTDAPRAQLLRAVVLASIEKNADAIDVLKKHLEKNPASIAGHYHLGMVSEKVGDVATATAAYQWFLDEPQRFLDKWLGQGPEAFESAADVTLIGRALDRHAVLTGGYRKNKELHNIILNMFVRAYDVIDRGYVPAHVAAAAYFLSHDDKPQVQKEIAAALKGNPNDPEAIEIAARAHLDEHHFADVLLAVDALREINPHSVTADILELNALVRGDRSGGAQILADKLLAGHPANLEILGLAAACAAARGDEAGCDTLLARADSVAPGSAVALFAAADALPPLYQYAAAERLCKAAVDRAPLGAAPLHELGRMYMHLAREEDAQATFDAAYEIDPFNISTVNYLRVLDDMKAFETVKSPNFIVKFDPKMDPILGEYAGPMMEVAVAEVTARFKFTPPQPTILEIFPTTDAFSVRTAGMPGAETYGAALGPVMTAVAPRAGATLGPFNFARVLRHEFTHVVNLQQSEFRCPRWLTEGLAVSEEHVTYRFANVPKAVYEIASKGKFAPIIELSGSVLRPKSKIDGEMLYMQGFWVGRYLTEKYGWDSVLKLLEGYKLGKSDDDAFRYAIGKPTGEFDKEFAEWAKLQVKDWGYDAETTKRFDEIAKSGEEKIKARQFKEAMEVWQQASKLQPLNPLPHRRLAGLYIHENQPREALPHLKAFYPLELAENRFAKGISRIHRDLGEMKDAKQYALEAIYINPYDPDAHELMLEACEKSNDPDGVAREKRVMAKLEEWKNQARP